MTITYLFLVISKTIGIFKILYIVIRAPWTRPWKQNEWVINNRQMLFDWPNSQTKANIKMLKCRSALQPTDRQQLVYIYCPTYFQTSCVRHRTCPLWIYTATMGGRGAFDLGFRGGRQSYFKTLLFLWILP